MFEKKKNALKLLWNYPPETLHNHSESVLILTQWCSGPALGIALKRHWNRSVLVSKLL